MISVSRKQPEGVSLMDKLEKWISENEAAECKVCRSLNYVGTDCIKCIRADLDNVPVVSGESIHS